MTPEDEAALQALTERNASCPHGLWTNVLCRRCRRAELEQAHALGRASGWRAGTEAQRAWDRAGPLVPYPGEQGGGEVSVTQMKEALAYMDERNASVSGERDMAKGGDSSERDLQSMRPMARTDTTMPESATSGDVASVGAASPDTTPNAGRDAALRAAYDALDQTWAAIGDRLLAKGPLSKEYAHEVLRQINAAKAAVEAALKGGG